MTKIFKIFISIIFIFIVSINIYSQYLPEPKIKQNFPVELESGRGAQLPSAQFYDFDNDGYLEIIFSNGDYVHIIRSNGENFPGWPQYIESSAFNELSIGDIDGDGNKEIIVASCTRDGSIYALRANGEYMPGFPVTFLYPESRCARGPTLYDINLDGKLEIFFTTDYKVYGLDWRGKVLPGWPRTIPNGFYGFSSPRIADMDFDSIPEIFVSSIYTDWVDTTSYFMIVCYQPDGTLKSGWPFVRKNQWMFVLPLGAIGQFPDDDFKVLAFGTSRDARGNVYNYYFYLLNPLGEVVEGWPKELEGPIMVRESAAFINYKNQNFSDIVITGDLWGYLYAWEKNGTSLPKFPYQLPYINGLFYSDIMSVPIPYHDLQNGEFVLFTYQSLTINDTGYVNASRSNGTQMWWSPLKVNGRASSTPAFADLENDGTVEMVMATKTADQINYLYVWEFTDIPYDKQRFPWPVGNANRWNTGEFGFEPTDTTIVAVRNENGLPSSPKLYQNYPNPFNPTTKIKYEIDKRTKVKLCIYNTLGQKVTTLVDAEQQAGTYEAVFNGEKYPSGVYYTKLETAEYTNVKKLILMK